MATTHDLAQAARERQDFLQKQRTLLQAEEARYVAEAERLRELHRRNRQELSSYLLAETTDADLRRLEERLSYPGLLPIKRRFEAELQAEEAALAELMLDPEAAHNDFHVSQVQDEQAEVREVYERLRAQVTVWEGIAHFKELSARGFFAPGYKAGFFGWLRDWRSVSLLMAELEKVQAGERYPTPERVREVWTKLDGEAAPIFELWSGLEGRLAHLQALGSRRAELEGAPQRLFQAMYEALGAAIVRHIEGLPDETKVSLAGADKHLVIFLQKDAGLQKQVQYLEELRLKRIQPQLKQLGQDIDRLWAKIAKASRKYKNVPVSQVNKMRDVKYDSWAKRHTRLASMRERVGGFNKYQKGSFTQDYLWWDTITGRAPGDDIFEVRMFRSTYPGFDHRHYDAPWHGHHHHHDHYAGDPVGSALAMDEAADALADGFGSGGDDLWAGDAS